MILKKSVDILTTLNEDAFTSDDVFEYKNGFNVAVAFTEYDSETRWILDKSYGSLVFNHFTWGENDNGSLFTRRQKQRSHICSRDELGLTENTDAAKFFPIKESS